MAALLAGKQTADPAADPEDLVSALVGLSDSAVDRTYQPAVSIDCRRLVKVPVEAIALIAATLQPSQGDPVSAVIRAFELLELAAGGLWTLQLGKVGEVGYERGVREAWAFRTEQTALAEVAKNLPVDLFPNRQRGRVPFAQLRKAIYGKTRRDRAEAKFETWLKSAFALDQPSRKKVLRRWMQDGVPVMMAYRAFVEAKAAHEQHVSSVRRAVATNARKTAEVATTTQPCEPKRAKDRGTVTRHSKAPAIKPAKKKTPATRRRD
jgi:hypothetical protein